MIEIPWQIVAVAFASVAAVMVAVLMFVRDFKQAADLRERDHEREHTLRDAQIVKAIENGTRIGHDIYMGMLEKQTAERDERIKAIEDEYDVHLAALREETIKTILMSKDG